MISYALSPNSSGKASTLRPIPFDTTIRAPAPYLRTRIYAESLAEEAAYILTEWLATPQIQGSIAFPEISVPLTMTLKKVVKNSKGGKATSEVKTLVERLEEGTKWVEEQRRDVNFAPRDTHKVKDWEEGLRKKGENGSPLGRALRVMRKARERRERLLHKVSLYRFYKTMSLIRSSRQGRVKMRFWKNN
jgi:nucleolar complex protein 2